MTDEFQLDARQFITWLHVADETTRLDMLRWAKEAIEDGLIILEPQVVGRTPVGVSGDLQESFEQEVSSVSATEIQGELYSPLDYAIVVEHGRKIGKWPPYDAIFAWVIRTFGLDIDSKEAESVTFLVRRAIGKGTTKGIMKPYDDGGGARMVEDAYEEVKPQLEGRFEILLEYLEDALR